MVGNRDREKREVGKYVFECSAVVSLLTFTIQVIIADMLKCLGNPMENDNDASILDYTYTTFLKHSRIPAFFVCGHSTRLQYFKIRLT